MVIELNLKNKKKKTKKKQKKKTIRVTDDTKFGWNY